MKRPLIFLVALGVLLVPVVAHAHCDAIDGPVATAALKSLDTNNVNVALPYVPAAAEAEVTAAFRQALAVRKKDAEAKALADRYFMETVVRLHRAGEKAPYTGLKPAGTDFGPAIPEAEKAIASGSAQALATFLAHELEHAIAGRFRPVLATRDASKEPATTDGVPAARARVSAELEFIGYVERVHGATHGGGHAE